MKKWIRCILSALLIASLSVSTVFAKSFPDVYYGWMSVDAIDYVSDMGIMVGDKQGNFNPEQKVTRAEMATILCKAVGKADNLQKKGGYYTDVPYSHWANGYVVRASELGYISGYGNGKFGPSDTVTSEQALTMLVKAAGLREEAVYQGGYPQGYINVAVEKGFISGVMFEGRELTRDDVAQLIYDYFMSSVYESDSYDSYEDDYYDDYSDDYYDSYEDDYYDSYEDNYYEDYEDDYYDSYEDDYYEDYEDDYYDSYEDNYYNDYEDDYYDSYEDDYYEDYEEECTHPYATITYISEVHPHYTYYYCAACDQTFPKGNGTYQSDCRTCAPVQTVTKERKVYGSWSGWSTTPVQATAIREVETKQVKVSDGKTEYRYGRYIADGHDYWCQTYMAKRIGSSGTVDYSAWSPIRYANNGKNWTCGFCNGAHYHVDHTSSDGRDWWKQFNIGGQFYYWEESRAGQAQYETQYRYRDFYIEKYEETVY